MRPESQLADRFAVFESTCEAAGINTPSGRLEAFLNLPEPVQDIVFSDVAKRITGRDLIAVPPDAN